MHAAILPPALDREAARAERLLVSAGGALAAVPMAALVVGGDAPDTVAGPALARLPWLVRRQAVATPVSLRMLAAAHGPARAARFAGIGAPALAGSGDLLALRSSLRQVGAGTAGIDSLPALPGAAQELERMADALGGEDRLLLTGARATRDNVRALDLSGYRVLAFATHGLVSGELRGVTEPGLVLTPPPGNAAPEAAILSSSDIAELRLDADWVILSACNTAAGDHPGAPMYSGLARAFVYAGARALLLSHWQVRDDVAARLSVDTVQGNHKGLGRAEALRQAQLRLIDDRTVAGGAHPRCGRRSPSSATDAPRICSASHAFSAFGIMTIADRFARPTAPRRGLRGIRQT